MPVYEDPFDLLNFPDAFHFTIYPIAFTYNPFFINFLSFSGEFTFDPVHPPDGIYLSLSIPNPWYKYL